MDRRYLGDDVSTVRAARKLNQTNPGMCTHGVPGHHLSGIDGVRIEAGDHASCQFIAIAFCDYH